MKLLKLVSERAENSVLLLLPLLQCMLGILGLGSDEEEESEEEEEEGEEGFLSAVTSSAFLFLLRRKFPLSNIFSQFGSIVQ